MDKIVGLLGLASASRSVSIGETMIRDIRQSKCKFVIIAEDASDNTKKKISDKCKFYNVGYAFVESSEELSKAVGKYNIKAVGILESGFAKKIKTSLKG